MSRTCDKTRTEKFPTYLGRNAVLQLVHNVANLAVELGLVVADKELLAQGRDLKSRARTEKQEADDDARLVRREDREHSRSNGLGLLGRCGAGAIAGAVAEHGVDGGLHVLGIDTHVAQILPQVVARALGQRSGLQEKRRTKV